VIDAPHFSGATHPSLHFIGDEKDSILLSSFTYSRPEIIRRDDRASFSLDRFHHHGSNPDTDRFTDFELAFDGFGISIGDVIDWASVELTYGFSVVFFSDHRK
jgi:hypothetical protein